MYERKLENDTSNNIDNNLEEISTVKSSSAYPYIWKDYGDDDPLKIITELNKSLPDLKCELLSPLSGDENAQSDCVDKTEESSSTDISKKNSENGRAHRQTLTLNICPNTGKSCSITKSNDTKENTSNNLQSKDINDGIPDDIHPNLVNSPAQSNAYQDMPILDDNSLSMRPPETQSVIHSIPDMSSQLQNIGHNKNPSELSVPVVTTQAQSENINGIYSRRPFHLQDKTSFLFLQPYFPGYYSPSLLNTDLSQSVHYDTPFKMLPLHQMGQRFPNYQNSIGLHPYGNPTTSSVTAAAHTIRHFSSTGIGMNNQMHCPQQHTVNGNNSYGS